MNNTIYRFDEVLTDGHNCLLLGDPYTLKHFQNENKLGEDLQTAFTTTQAGDEVVKSGTMIYLGNVSNPYNEAYTLFFNFDDKSILEDSTDAKIIHKADGYLLNITNKTLYAYSWRYLLKFNQDTIDQLYKLSGSSANQKIINGKTYIQSNSVRQRIAIPNGYYQVSVNAGYFEDDNPVFELIIKPTTQTCIESNLDYLTSYDYRL